MKHVQWVRITAALALVMGLGACAPLVVGGFVGGAMVATDRRTSGTQLEDEGIELRSANRIREMVGDRVHVNITSYNRQVLLTGEVPNDRDRQYLAKLVSEVDNVRTVVNELAVMPASSLGDRSTDALITGKIKASMLDSKDIFASAYKVVTERGNVYLMGRVTQREANRATEVARTVGGVKKVVRVFEIITEEELKAAFNSEPDDHPLHAECGWWQPLPADRDQGNTNSQHLPVDAELVADHRDRGGCPWIITGDEGTSHCSLAERGSSDLDALVAMPEWQAWVAAEDAMGKACRREKRRG